MHNAAYVDLYISSGFRRWRPALGLTVSDTLLSLGRARGPAANGRYQGTADIAGDRGGCRRHAPADRPRTSSRSSRMTAPLQLDGSLPTRCCPPARPAGGQQCSACGRSVHVFVPRQVDVHTPFGLVESTGWLGCGGGSDTRELRFESLSIR